MLLEALTRALQITGRCGRGLSAVVAIGYYGEVGPASMIAAGSRSPRTAMKYFFL
jgi:hypothetical protein